MKEWIRNGVFVLILLLGAIFFWRLWVPEFTLFESPNWDESDRARDAYVLFEGFKNLNPVPAIQQLLFFETWGPMFAFVAQIPLVFFGLQAHSLSLVSFFAFFVASFGFLLCAQSKLGWNRAFAIAVFSFFWIVGGPDRSGWRLLAESGLRELNLRPEVRCYTAFWLDRPISLG